MKLIDTELGGTTPLDILITFKNENNENFNEINIDDDEILEDDELLSDDLFEELDILGPEVKDLVNTNPKIAKALISLEIILNKKITTL